MFLQGRGLCIVGDAIARGALAPGTDPEGFGFQVC